MCAMKNMTLTPFPEFEQGPIRPPSEAKSLFVRVNRNCAWNQCTFCPVYKAERFSARSAKEVIADIDMLARCAEKIRLAQKEGPLLWDRLYPLQLAHPEESPLAFSNAFRWLQEGTGHIFLQDASVFSTPAADLIKMVSHIHQKLSPTRITAYAHARDILKYTAEELRTLQSCGLTQIHLGLESGSEKVLRSIHKGASREEMITAGQMCRNAGMKLCVYIMPGLGGKMDSKENAIHTASAIRKISPNVVRLRTLQLLPGTKLWDDFEKKEFIPLSQINTVAEIRLFLEHVTGVQTTLISDHMLNVLEEIEGILPSSLPQLKQIADTFLAWPIEKQTAFIIGRRAGLLRQLEDIEKPKRREKINHLLEMWQVTPENLEDVSFEMMRQYIY